MFTRMLTRWSQPPKKEMSPDEITQFKEWGVPLPSRDIHVKDEDIVKNLQPANPRNWRLEGNVLKADTDFGSYAHQIPTDYIMDGVDDNNLPILRKLDIT